MYTYKSETYQLIYLFAFGSSTHFTHAGFTPAGGRLLFLWYIFNQC